MAVARGGAVPHAEPAAQLAAACPVKVGGGAKVKAQQDVGGGEAARLSDDLHPAAQGAAGGAAAGGVAHPQHVLAGQQLHQAEVRLPLGAPGRTPIDQGAFQRQPMVGAAGGGRARRAAGAPGARRAGMRLLPLGSLRALLLLPLLPLPPPLLIFLLRLIVLLHLMLAVFGKVVVAFQAQLPACAANSVQ